MASKRKRKLRESKFKSAGKKGRSGASARAKEIIFNILLPGVLICMMLLVLGYIGLIGYQGATASGFFALKENDGVTVEIVTDSERPQMNEEEVKKIAANLIKDTGVWNADLQRIRDVISQNPYVEKVSVSRILPDQVFISIKERARVAVVRKGEDLFWVDINGFELGPTQKNVTDPRIVIVGWDSAATPDQKRSRIQAFLKVSKIWNENNLIDRVKEVDLSNLSDIGALIEEKSPIDVRLGRLDRAEKLEVVGIRLRQAIEFAAVHQGPIRKIVFVGDQMSYE
jgi:cell division septal protein FtsQ